MSKFNTISLDAADTLFYIKEGLGGFYNKILKNIQITMILRIFLSL